MKIIRARPGHEKIIANFHAVNEEHLRPWSPAVARGHHSVSRWKRRLEEREIDFENGHSVHFIGTDAAESHVIGGCSLTNILRGVFQSCQIGYSVAQRYEGEGYMKEIAAHAIAWAFDELGLHRINAGHMPANERSAALLKSLGFEREGYARDYLLIDGRWEDHVLHALINRNCRRSP